jgi:hypothetical protein
MILSGAAAFHAAIVSGSPLTMPMMFRLVITASVSRMNCVALVTATSGCGQGALASGGTHSFGSSAPE